jgi:hypothetical protein
MRMTITFGYTHSIDVDVAPEAIWALYDDIGTWTAWDPDLDAVTRDGPLATGTTGTLTFRGQEPLAYRLLDVEPFRHFVDEVPVGELVVRVSHELEPLPSGSLRITYSAEIEGPEAQAGALGPAITADFPETMRSLVACARERSA